MGRDDFLRDLDKYIARTASHKTGTFEFGVVAKILGVGRNKFIGFMKEEQYLMKNCLPYQKFINDGYFSIPAPTIGEAGIHISSLFTVKGLRWIWKKSNNGFLTLAQFRLLAGGVLPMSREGGGIY